MYDFIFYNRGNEFISFPLLFDTTGYRIFFNTGLTFFGLFPRKQHNCKKHITLLKTEGTQLVIAIVLSFVCHLFCKYSSKIFRNYLMRLILIV